LQVNNGVEAEDEGAFFWDPSPASKDRDAKAQAKLLQQKLDKATLRIQELQLQIDDFRQVIIIQCQIKIIITLTFKISFPNSRIFMLTPLPY
jgi:hypothetical protein